MKKLAGLVTGLISLVIAIGGCDSGPDTARGTGISTSTSTASVNLYTCEQHEFRQCKVDVPGDVTTFVDCLFTNKSQVPVLPDSFGIWNYDAQGVLLGKGHVIAPGPVSPGRTVHLDIRTRSEAAKSVICSMDPEDATQTGVKSRRLVIN